MCVCVCVCVCECVFVAESYRCEVVSVCVCVAARQDFRATIWSRCLIPVPPTLTVTAPRHSSVQSQTHTHADFSPFFFSFLGYFSPVFHFIRG